MLIEETLHLFDRSMRCRLESRKTDSTASRVEHAERRIVGPHQRNGSLQHQRRYLAKIRAGIQRIGNRQERALCFSFAFLVGVESCVLIADRDLSRDRLKK